MTIEEVELEQDLEDMDDLRDLESQRLYVLEDEYK